MSGEQGSEPSRAKAGSSSSDDEKQAKAAREQMMRLVFSTEARERLNNIRMVKPELATSIENQVFQLAASGRIRKQISDDELKEMLSSVQQPKKEFKISWK
ncbi:MAG TPA: DNA-binding protein [Nitrososphaerales archaeon]|nr:DNA-binding protein [Nitrososphaerales archaeon]